MPDTNVPVNDPLLMVEVLRDFSPRLLEKLDAMARALQHAHGLYLQATKAPAALQSLTDRNMGRRSSGEFKRASGQD